MLDDSFYGLRHNMFFMDDLPPPLHSADRNFDPEIDLNVSGEGNEQPYLYSSRRYPILLLSMFDSITK